ASIVWRKSFRKFSIGLQIRCSNNCEIADRYDNNASEIRTPKQASWAMRAKSGSRKKRVGLIVGVVALAVLGWVLYDLYAPRTAHLREFDADEVARLETAMWRSYYEKALPDLVKFYQSLRKMSDIPFDVDRAARLELEWWIIHRERAKHAPGDLDRALAELQAEIYQIPIEHLLEHGRLRAEAMTIRDTKAAAGGVTDADWAMID